MNLWLVTRMVAVLYEPLVRLDELHLAVKPTGNPHTPDSTLGFEVQQCPASGWDHIHVMNMFGLAEAQHVGTHQFHALRRAGMQCVNVTVAAFEHKSPEILGMVVHGPLVVGADPVMEANRAEAAEVDHPTVQEWAFRSAEFLFPDYALHRVAFLAVDTGGGIRTIGLL